MRPNYTMLALLIAMLPDEALQRLAAEQRNSATCICNPEVRARQETANGTCWNCGKPVNEIT